MLAVSEIISNIAPYVLRTQEACYAELKDTNISNKPSEKCEGDLPTKNCSVNFLIIRDFDESENKTSRAARTENCLFIESRDSEILKTTDALLFRILGIN